MKSLFKNVASLGLGVSVSALAAVLTSGPLNSASFANASIDKNIEGKVLDLTEQALKPHFEDAITWSEYLNAIWNTEKYNVHELTLDEYISSAALIDCSETQENDALVVCKIAVPMIQDYQVKKGKWDSMTVAINTSESGEESVTFKSNPLDIGLSSQK